MGLAVPALSLPGPGPQFQQGFARRQSRLLGGSVRPCTSSTELVIRLERLLGDSDLRQRLGRIGQRRMGGMVAVIDWLVDRGSHLKQRHGY